MNVDKFYHPQPQRKKLPNIDEEDDEGQILRKYNSEVVIQEKRGMGGNDSDNHIIIDDEEEEISPKSGGGLPSINNTPPVHQLNHYNSTSSFVSGVGEDTQINQYFTIIFGAYFKHAKLIDRDLFSMALKRQAQDLSDEEINHLFDMADQNRDGLVSEQEVRDVIEKDIQQKRLDTQELEMQGSDDDCDIEGGIIGGDLDRSVDIQSRNSSGYVKYIPSHVNNNANQEPEQDNEIYDQDGFEKFKEDIFIIFDTYSDTYKGQKCLDLKYLNNLANPEVKMHAKKLDWLVQDLQYESQIGIDKLTIDDLEAIVSQYDEFLKGHYNAQAQKNSVRKLIENLQDFNKSNDSPLELMKDMFMYLIQKQKFKKYSQDDWFQLVNAIHQFLANLETESTSDTIKFEKKELNNDYTVSYFENELKSYKEQNRTLFEMIEEKKTELSQYAQEKTKLKEENQRYKSSLLQAQEELEQLRKIKRDYETKFQRQEEVLLNLSEENDELNKQIDMDSDQIGKIRVSSRRFDVKTSSIDQKVKMRKSVMDGSIRSFALDQLANNEQGVQQELSRLQEERDRYKSLYEKLEKEVNNLSEELEEMHSKHTAELKAVKSNLEFRKQQIEIKQQEVEDKRKEIVQLQKALTDCQGQINNLNQSVSALKSANLILEQKLSNNNDRFETQSNRSRFNRTGALDEYQSQFNNSVLLSPRPRGLSRVSGGTNIFRRQDSMASGSVYSRGSSTSIILKVIGSRSNYSQSNRSFMSGSSQGSVAFGQRRRKQGLGLGGKIGGGDKSRMGSSYGGSVRSGRSGRSAYSKRSGVQIVDGDSELDDSDTRSMQSSTSINVIESNDPVTKKIFHNTTRKAPTLAIDEIDEDKEDDEDFDGSYVDSNSGQLVINFETIYAQVREFEADFEDTNDYVSMYKENVSYFQISSETPGDVVCLESYMIMTKKYLYVFDLSKEEYPMVHNPPIKIDDIQAIQMTFNNNLAGVFRIKNRKDVKHVVFEDETLEQFVIFLKGAFGIRIAIDYQDQIYFKNEKTNTDDLAFNLIDMKYFDPKDLRVRFNKPQYYGFLEKISCNWRSKVSSIFGGGTKWVKKMYAIKNGTVYVYELNNYDRPSKTFQVGHLGVLSIKNNKEYNKANVFKLLCPDDDQRVFGAVDEKDRDAWVECIQDAIDDYKEKQGRR